MAFLNRCIFRPTSGGTGTWTVSSAIAGFDTPANCTNPAVVANARYYYFAESDDQQSWEIGQGVSNGSTTLTRETIYDSTNGGAAVNFTSAPRVAMGCPLAQVGGREVLLAARSYFVRSDGSNNNNGLANTAGGAFLTLQFAYDYICANIDKAGFDATINMQASTTFTGGLAASGPWTGGGGITISGSSTVISTTSANALGITCTLPGVLTITGIKLQTTTSGDCINHAGPGVVAVGSTCEFGASAGNHLYANAPGAKIQGFAAYTISGGATVHLFTQGTGATIVMAGATVTLTGTPAFSYFADANGCSRIYAGANTYSGSASAGTTRYYVDTNSSIETSSGASPTYFPGGIAGSTATGGQYS